MWGYQLHDRPILYTLIQPSETSSSNYQRLSRRSRETRVRNSSWILPTSSYRARRVLLHAVNLRHGTDGFTSRPKEGVLRILSPLKSILLGRVWTREPWVQWQARNYLVILLIIIINITSRWVGHTDQPRKAECEMHTKFRSDVKIQDHSATLAVDGRIILKHILKEYGMRINIGWIWFGIGTICRLLLTL
jgi:hypothetical protein